MEGTNNPLVPLQASQYTAPMSSNKLPRKNLESEFSQVSVSIIQQQQRPSVDATSARQSSATTATAESSVVPAPTSPAVAVSTTAKMSTDPKTFSVHLRLRPSSSTTLEQLNTTTVRAHPPRQGPTKDYTFTNILPATTSQFEVYQQTAAPMVQGLFASSSTANKSKDQHQPQLGSSALLFCYGITNAGKTYTVTGDLNHESKWGLLPRALQDAFHRAQTANLTLQLGYMEVYNEQVYDLLQPQDKYTRACPQVKIRENHNGLAVCKGLVQVTVESVQHGLTLVHSAKGKRQTCSNNLNAGSSRSHCICQLTITSHDGHNQQQQVSMWIVDLAGSERSKRTDAGQARLKEASQINKSLMTLMRCLMALREESNNTKTKERPPYRDSKMTHLLMNHLTGPSAGRTTMIVNVHPAECDYEETQHVLQYAAQARHVVVQPAAATTQNGDLKRAAIQYGEDGRKIVPQGKVAKLIAKLSPLLSPAGRARKRKGGQTGKDAKVKKLKSSATTSASTTALAVGASKAATAADASKELRRLKMQLSVLQADNQILKQTNKSLTEENESLKDQLEAVEENIRAEVVEEMEAKQIEMNEKYESLIDGLKHSLRDNAVLASTTKSTRKLQKLETQDQLDRMADTIGDLEEENKRLLIQHQAKIKAMQLNHQSVLDSLRSRVEMLEAKEKPQTKRSGNDVDDESKDEATLRLELQTARALIAKLEEENSNYKKCMGDGDEEDSNDDMDADELDEESYSDGDDIGEEEDGEEEEEEVPVEDEEEQGLDTNPSHIKALEEPSPVEQLEAAEVSSGSPEPRELSNAAVVDTTSTETGSNGSITEGHTDSLLDETQNDEEKVERTAYGGGLQEINVVKDPNVLRSRLPFGDIADNSQDSEESDEFGPNQWLFPKKGAKKDENGDFMRPKGRKPKNAEDWDTRKGAWRLSMA